MKKILIVDTRLVAYETYHRRQGILNTIQLIYDYANFYGGYSKIIFAWDSKYGSKRRKTLYKDYKGHRKEQVKKYGDEKRLEKFNKEFSKMENIFKSLGNVVHIDGIEADDIANVVVELFSDKYEIYMLSSDKDWLSNLNKNTHQIHLKRGLITLENVYQEFGLFPNQILEIQALTGVAKENIKGVHKLGETRVKKLFNEGYSIDEIIYKVQEWVDIGKYGMKLIEGFTSVKELYKFNYNILRKFLWNDFTEDEKLIFKGQINYRLSLSEDDLQNMLIEDFTNPIILDNKLLKFFKV